MAHPVFIAIDDAAQTRGITRAQIARAMRVNPARVSTWLNHHSESITLRSLERLAGAVGCEVVVSDGWSPAESYLRELTEALSERPLNLARVARCLEGSQAFIDAQEAHRNA